MILVYSEHSSPREKYIFGFILNEILGIDYELTSDLDVFVKSSLPRINYSTAMIDGTVTVVPHSLLFETKIEKQEIEVTSWKGIPIFFRNNSGDLSFDVFAAGFFLLSRYEEYLSDRRDHHGRFPVEESLAFRSGFLEKPVVDQWAMMLGEIIKAKFPEVKIRERKFTFVPTIDVDVAFAYRHKGIARTVGAFAKALVTLDFADNYHRLMVLLHRKKDPYDTYDLLESLHGRYHLNPVFFFLVGKYGPFDKNHSLKNSAFQSLIRRMAGSAKVGLHPSYRSNADAGAFESELQDLAEVSGRKIDRSRQHFLKLSVPQTYRGLIANGISEDYTMGFAQRPGFRAGTCTPFYFYDLEKEAQTALRVFPFQVMDGTLNQYMKLNQEEALDKIRELVREVRLVNGTFISLWHNSSLGELREWRGWSDVYEEMLKICNPE